MYRMCATAFVAALCTCMMRQCCCLLVEAFEHYFAPWAEQWGSLGVICMHSCAACNPNMRSDYSLETELRQETVSCLQHWHERLSRLLCECSKQDFLSKIQLCSTALCGKSTAGSVVNAWLVLFFFFSNIIMDSVISLLLCAVVCCPCIFPCICHT